MTAARSILLAAIAAALMEAARLAKLYAMEQHQHDAMPNCGDGRRQV